MAAKVEEAKVESRAAVEVMVVEVVAPCPVGTEAVTVAVARAVARAVVARVVVKVVVAKVEEAKEEANAAWGMVAALVADPQVHSLKEA